MAEPGSPTDGITLTHFIVSDDVERSRRFYTEVLGGTLERSGEPTNIALANSWIVINRGGGPTDDKPSVTLEAPGEPDRVSSVLNIRVKDIETVYSEWSARGAEFLTPPKQHPFEIRCHIRDPDGHLIELGQTTDSDGDWTPRSGCRVRPARSPTALGRQKPAICGLSTSGDPGIAPGVAVLETASYGRVYWRFGVCGPVCGPVAPPHPTPKLLSALRDTPRTMSEESTTVAWMRHPRERSHA